MVGTFDNHDLDEEFLDSDESESDFEEEIEESPKPKKELSLAEIKKLSTESEDWDIFDDVGDPLYRSGDKVKYTIKRNGEYVTTMEHPCSYQTLQKKFGGGSYQVICRSTKAGKYIKSQSRLIAAPDHEPEETTDSSSEKDKNSNNTMEVLAILQTMNEKAEAQRREEAERLRREAREMEAKKEKESQNMMTIMMTMMNAQVQAQKEASNQMVQLLVPLLASKKDDDRYERIIERMEDRFEKIVEKIADRDGGSDIDPIELIKLREEAETKGYQRAQEIRQLAQLEAERLAETGGGGGSDSDESPTQTLLKTLVPMFAAAAMQPAAPRPQLPAPQARPQAPRPQAPRPQPTRMQAAPKPQPKPQTTRGIPIAGQGVIKKEKPMDQKTKVSETVISIIGQRLMKMDYKPENAAQEALERLKADGITPDWLYANYTLDDMIKIAASKGMPSAINKYLEGFHAYIKAQVSVGTGENSASGGDKSAV